MANQSPYRITLIPAPTYLPWAAPIAHALEASHYPLTLLTDLEPRLNDLEGDYVVYIGALADDLAAHLNHVSHRQHIPLIFVTPSAESFQIGPAVLHGRLPCVECYREAHRFFPANGFEPQPARSPYPESDAAALAARFARAVAAFIAGDPGSFLLRGEIAYLTPTTLRPQRTTRGWRYGGCPVCSAWAMHPSEVYVAKHKGE